MTVPDIHQSRLYKGTMVECECPQCGRPAKLVDEIYIDCSYCGAGTPEDANTEYTEEQPSFPDLHDCMREDQQRGKGQPQGGGGGKVRKKPVGRRQSRPEQESVPPGWGGSIEVRQRSRNRGSGAR